MSRTIVAQATASGQAGIGVVRLSGPKAYQIALNLTQKKQLKPRVAYFTAFYNASEKIDEGLVLFFKAPFSYTGEDTVELQGHGNDVVLQSVIHSCINLGAEMALPGEFTQRAFLNGKLDLAQAEAVADLIHSKTHQCAKASLNSLQGVFSDKIRSIQNGLTELRVWVESSIDFSDENIEVMSDAHFKKKHQTLVESYKDLIDCAKQGVLLNNGITVAVIGPPNAGKSSLMNALTKNSTSIVTNIPGTTRDVIKETLSVDGLMINLLDTAGVRKSDDEVEKIGIQRTIDAIYKADHYIFVFDVNENNYDPKPFWQQHINDMPFPEEHYTLVLNKMDRMNDPDSVPLDKKTVPMSVKEGKGIKDLLSCIKMSVGYLNRSEGVYSLRERHLVLLQQSLTHLELATEYLKQHQLEMASEDLKYAQNDLGLILGEVTTDDLLGEIFSSFCIGK